jgi:hypothetical protein
MKKIIVFAVVSLLIASVAFAAGMRVKEDKDDKHKNSSMRSKSDDSGNQKTSSMRQKKTQLNWQFRPGDVNPTVDFFDTTDGNRVLMSNIKVKGNLSLMIECTKGHEICYGGNFELVGKKFVAGCGANCSELSRLDGSWRNDSCAVCEDGTVTKNTKVRQDRREVNMSWRFQKGDVNPDVSFYNVSDGNRQISGSHKLKGDTTVNVRCMENDMICFGGDFELVGKQFTIGCGQNCGDLNSLSGGEKSEACQPCAETTVTRPVKMKKK